MEAGKSRSRWNALKRGVLASAPVMRLLLRMSILPALNDPKFAGESLYLGTWDKRNVGSSMGSGDRDC
jgi:hypothetical protein